MTLTFSSRCDIAEGWISFKDGLQPWRLIADNFLCIGLRRDYGTIWQKGQEVSTDRCGALSVSALLKRHYSPTVMGGDNALECQRGCGKTPHSNYEVLLQQPRHLVVTLARMAFSHDMSTTAKHMDMVDLDRIIRVPVHGTAEAAGASGNDASFVDYGLYAVVVHSGASANSGHYYTYARLSEGSDLSEADASSNPWIKFNDTEVQGTMLQLIPITAPCCYTLLYRPLQLLLQSRPGLK